VRSSKIEVFLVVRVRRAPFIFLHNFAHYSLARLGGAPQFCKSPFTNTGQGYVEQWNSLISLVEFLCVDSEWPS
jgi:hypothetical protein